MAFGNSTNSWVAGHLPDQVKIDRNKSGLRAKPCGGRSRFAASVACPDYDHIKTFVKHIFLLRYISQTFYFTGSLTGMPKNYLPRRSIPSASKSGACYGLKTSEFNLVRILI
jgi:hypothetical protein